MNRAHWQHRMGRIADRIPLTGRGLVAALISGLATSRLGYGSLDLVALTVGLAGLGLVCSAGLAAGGYAIWLRARLRALPESVLPVYAEVGSPINTGFALPLPRWLPVVALEWRWQAPPNVDCRVFVRDGQVIENVRLLRRCEVAGVCRRIEVRDVFRFWRIIWHRNEQVAVTGLPGLGALRRIGAVHSLSGGEYLPHPEGAYEGDRIEIRRYAPGDPVRNILWKAFARTRDLYVRTPEQSIADSKRTLAYLVVGDGDEPAAAALRLAVQSGALGEDWTVGADGVEETAETLPLVLSLIARSGNEDASDRASGLEAFLRVSSRGSTRCIVFAPAGDETWLDTALAAVANWPGTRFVLAADGVVTPGVSPLWQRALLVRSVQSGVRSKTLSEVVARITAAGHSAIFVDRASGKVAGEDRLVPTRRSA